MDSKRGVLEQFSEDLVETAERLGPALVSLKSGRWRTTAVPLSGAEGALIAPAHALEGAEEVAITAGGVASTAKVVGRDGSLDLALLQTDLPLAALAWEEAPLRPGQLVIGLSRPGDSLRVRLGQVAEVGERSFTALGGRLEETVELAWLGRNALATLVVDARGAARAFAISGGGRRGWVLSTRTVNRAMAQIRALGTVRRGYLGVVAQPVRLPAPVPEQRGCAVGLLVTAVEPDGPAAKAGLLLGDALVGLGEGPLTSMTELWAALGPERVGQTVRLEILRAGQPVEVSLEIGARP
jgi:S1-C subfamily serine protease